MKVMIKKRDPCERIHNFEEVNIGYSLNEAVEEAMRCEQCKEPSCISGCPIAVDIPGFIKCIRNKDAKGAAEIIKETNHLPGICSRLCPQERLCEASCKLAPEGNAISIGNLGRFASDNEDNIFIMPEKIPKRSKENKSKKNQLKVAVIGSGPAGLVCSSKLAEKGYSVDVFEALHDIGGVLMYGIPEFRLPRQILHNEVENIRKMGVNFHVNHIIGRTLTVEDLKKDYDAIFIGTGAGLPNLPNIPGEHLNGVETANEYLTRLNFTRPYRINDDENNNKNTPQNVIVVGGGNTAMDCARSAKRLGSDVTLVYRRSYSEMTVRKEEFENAKEEGINFIFLTNPTRIIGKERVEAVELIQMMTENDSNGNKKIVPIDNTEFRMECEQVIFAIGQGPNPLITKTTNISHRLNSSIVVDNMLRTSEKMVFAGGDVIGGDATVIKAIKDGILAAEQIDVILGIK